MGGSIALGGASAAVVSWFATLPRIVIDLLVWVVASGLVFIFLSLVFMWYGKAQRRIKELVADNPLKKRVDALEKKLGPRTISPEEKEKLVQHISGMPGRIRIWAVYDDQDAISYANEFAELLTQNGWEVWGVDLISEYNMERNGTQIGLTLYAPYAGRGFHAHANVQGLADGLRLIGLNNFYAAMLMHEGACELYVGHRG